MDTIKKAEQLKSRKVKKAEQSAAEQTSRGTS